MAKISIGANPMQMTVDRLTPAHSTDMKKSS
jgi:hypothetical protein